MNEAISVANEAQRRRCEWKKNHHDATIFNWI